MKKIGFKKTTRYGTETFATEIVLTCTEKQAFVAFSKLKQLRVKFMSFDAKNNTVKFFIRHNQKYIPEMKKLKTIKDMFLLERKIARNKIIKKNDVVTAISVQGNNVVIQDTVIGSTGPIRTSLGCFKGWYETSTLFPSIKKLEERVYCFNCIVPNEAKEDFIERYIKVAKEQRIKDREKVLENLNKHPLSKRYQRHYELCKEDIGVRDLREVDEVCCG